MTDSEKNLTYGSNYEEKLLTATGGISAKDRDDQFFVEALISRMGSSAVFCEGSSTVLYRGRLEKLNRGNYTLTARVRDGGWEIPVSFAAEHFGVFSDRAGDSYVSVEDVAADLNGYSVFADPENGICILQSPDARSFAADEERDANGNSNSAYRKRMARFFREPLIPEPCINVEQTRKVISEAPYPAGVTDWRNTAYVTCYSPAILCRTEQGQKVIYAANEFSKVLNWKEIETVTVIKKSTDDGETWSECARLPHIRWGGLFEHNGAIYLCGTNGEKKTVSYYRFREDMTYDEAHFDFGCGWTSPNPVLEYNGRIYQALGTAAVSAPCDADLLKRESWTVSSSLSPLLTREWFERESGEPEARRFTVMEGNMLAGPDGKVYNIMRTESQPAAGYAAILELSADGTTYLPVESCNSLLHFPTSVSKFVIRQDEQTGKYFSLTSVKTIPHFGDQRNILSLVWSDDLLHWHTAGILLTDREMMNPVCSAYAHSFQYVDFVIDGEDILMAVREAAGKCNIWHDGTHITFYRLRNFRALAV